MTILNKSSTLKLISILEELSCQNSSFERLWLSLICLSPNPCFFGVFPYYIGLYVYLLIDETFPNHLWTIQPSSKLKVFSKNSISWGAPSSKLTSYVMLAPVNEISRAVVKWLKTIFFWIGCFNFSNWECQALSI